MSDWQPGDLALCVRSGLITRAGSVYTVSEILLPDERYFEDGLSTVNRTGGTQLRFVEVLFSFSRWSDSERFRKITPGAKIEGFEERRRLPVKEPA